MYENDFDIEMFTSDELLAEIGLDAYTIRKPAHRGAPTGDGRRSRRVQ